MARELRKSGRVSLLPKDFVVQKLKNVHIHRIEQGKVVAKGAKGEGGRGAGCS